MDSDLFMRRVKNKEKWSLFCPTKASGLIDIYGEEYEKLYEKYEREKRYIKQIDAQKLWFQICNSQIETGTPYLLYKDSINNKSNQKNVGTIKSSNLCVSGETNILTDEGEIEIEKCVNRYVNIWNGNRYSNVLVKKTCEMTQLMRVIFNTGRHIDCTYTHYFYVQTSPNLSVKVPAMELQRGQELITYRAPDGSVIKTIITGIIKEFRFGPTYCFAEPYEQKGVFNGVLTGQCTEIVEYTAPDEIAVCNLASISLPMFVDETIPSKFNLDKLHDITRLITRNLNNVIDLNFYPLQEAKKSNLRHRPVGIGVQGLADVYMLLKYPFDSEDARKLNVEIFETIYHASLMESIELSKIYGPYETFQNSPAANGYLQFDMWENDYEHNSKYDWESLKFDIKKYGLRNSLLVAPMPTASTSQILGNNECIEPYTSNIYLRRTMAGEFVVINKHMIKDLIELGLWSDNVKDEIIYHEGSIQKIQEIPQHIKNLYKTAWELKQKVLIDQAADRGRYICQSQSLNLFVSTPDLKTLSSMHFYSWTKGLKTGIFLFKNKTSSKSNKIYFES